MYTHHEGLFAEFELRQFLAGKMASAINEVKLLSLNTFESNSDEEIVENILLRYEVTPLSIKEDEKDVDFIEVKVDARKYGNRAIFDDSREVLISGYKVTWKIPVQGTLELFNSQPSSRLLITFRGNITNNKLIIETQLPADMADEDAIKKALQSDLSHIMRMVNNINTDLVSYPQDLRTSVVSAISSRKQELEKIQKIKTALRVNVQPKSDATPLNPVKIELKSIPVLSTSKEEPGAFITDDSYEVILKSIRNMGASMEGSPASHSNDEEALRDMMLVGLNASMSSGSAGGELFRKNGKTDITILFENKAAFVAECKLWKGASYISGGIDQLLGYLTWRDAKTSLIIFNKENKNFSDIQNQIESIFKEHKGFVRKSGAKEGEWKFVFTKPDDSGRMIIIHVFLFDLFSKS